MAKIDEDRVRRIEHLVRQLELSPDGETRETAHALMTAVLELHGAGLERMMEIVFEAGDTGKTAIRRFAGDGLVASLLVLHGLHPDDMETRVHQALSKMHASAELLGIFEGVVRVRLSGSGREMRESVEAALREALPDAADILIEEVPALHNFVPLEALGGTLPRNA